MLNQYDKTTNTSLKRPSPDAAANRLHCISQKISREASRLNGSLFCHVDFRADGWPDAVRISFKGKDLSTIDRVATALGDAITEILQAAHDG